MIDKSTWRMMSLGRCCREGLFTHHHMIRRELTMLYITRKVVKLSFLALISIQ